VLLSYWTSPEGSFLWVITAQGIELRKLPNEPTLRRDVEAYQAAILRSRDPLGEAIPEGERLWHSLVAPAAGLIPQGSRVVVVPDGPLHRLNFETLIVPGADPQDWIEAVILASTPALSLVSAPPRPRTTTQSILIIGDPLPPNAEFPRLAHAGREVQQISALFDPARRTVYSGIHADPSSYTSADPASFSLIHLAAHVTANREVPLESAVVLSPQGETYKLYARDVMDIPLNADLVTLSACRSAGSRAFAGEGLVGLAWAFMKAGARNVIGGLWDVEDASTSQLMEHLYRGLQEGQGPAQALRQAKLELLRSGTAYRKPFYWAPFVMYHGPAGLAPRQSTDHF
jgi:CHAT domain-containing protein